MVVTGTFTVPNKSNSPDSSSRVVPVSIILDATYPLSEISEDCVLRQNLPQSYVRDITQSRGEKVIKITRTVCADLRIPWPPAGGQRKAIGSNVRLKISAGRDFVVGDKRSAIRLGADWFRANEARLDDAGVGDPVEGVEWDDEPRAEPQHEYGDIGDTFKGMCISSSLEETSPLLPFEKSKLYYFSLHNVYQRDMSPIVEREYNLKASRSSQSHDSGIDSEGSSRPELSQPDCWYRTYALVADQSSPEHPEPLPLKVFRLEYDPSQPPPGGNLPNPGKRLVHFMEIGVEPDFEPLRQ